MVVTIDGYDKYSNTMIKKIHVWHSYENRELGISGKIKHGKRVKLIEREGDQCFIQFGFLKRKFGWITYWFIKELKENGNTK